MSKCVAIISAVLSLSLLTPSAASAGRPHWDRDWDEEWDDTPNITLEVKSMNGSGCRAGSTTVSPSSDSTTITVVYSDFDTPGGSVKNCQMVVGVHVPAGLTYAVYKIDNRGYTQLQEGATGRLLMTAYFSGQTTTLRARESFQGPYDHDWQSSQTLEQLDWAPCNVNRYLNINNTVRVNGSERDHIQLQSTDASASTEFHLTWKSCDSDTRWRY